MKLGLGELMAEALSIKLQFRKDAFSLCSIMNVRSGGCSEDCSFCAQSVRYKTDTPVYPLRPLDEVVEKAREAKACGASRFSMVASGRGIEAKDAERLAPYIEAIRDRVQIKVCASFGIAGEDALKILKDAGLSRYHHNLETSRDFFPKVVTTHTYEERLATLESAKRAGLEVCSGGIIGIGESEEERVLMAETLAYFDVDSVPINILVPIPGTPLEKENPLSIPEILRTISLFRIIRQDKPIRIAGGRETALADFQTLAFMAGADAMLIGGYLTVRGRSVRDDLKMVNELKAIWKSM